MQIRLLSVCFVRFECYTMTDLPIRWPSPDERSPLAINAMFQFYHDAWQTRRRKHCECYSPSSPIRPFVHARESKKFNVGAIFELSPNSSGSLAFCTEFSCAVFKYSLDMVLGKDMRHRTRCSNKICSHALDARVSVA